METPSSNIREFEDPKFKEELAAVISSLQHEGIQVTVARILEDVSDFIVKTHNGSEPFATTKSNWLRRINSTSAMLGVKLSKSSDDKIAWNNIERRLEMKHNQLSSMSERQSVASLPLSLSSSSHPSSSSSSSSSSSQSKQLLSDADKETIRLMYDSLDENRMWTLSTGKKVELVMKEMALACNFEHPCHSVILDLRDSIWSDYFTVSELEEIRSYNRKPLPDLPSDLQQYLDSSRTSGNANEASQWAKAAHFDPSIDFAREWAQGAIVDAARLLIFDVTRSNLTEGDFMHRVWGFIDKAFDNTLIRVTRGEKASRRSAEARNRKRSIAAVEEMPRQASGRKLDMLFHCDDYELGCTEAGITSMNNSTKELKDMMSKSPKVLKQMLCSLVRAHPSLRHHLQTIGFVMMGYKIRLVMMDNPCGYVCRVVQTDPLHFPTMSLQFTTRILPILEMTWKARMMMESVLTAMLNDKTKIVVQIAGTADESGSLPPCFESIPISSPRSFRNPKRQSTATD